MATVMLPDITQFGDTGAIAGVATYIINRFIVCLPRGQKGRIVTFPPLHPISENLYSLACGSKPKRRSRYMDRVILRRMLYHLQRMRLFLLSTRSIERRRFPTNM